MKNITQIIGALATIYINAPYLKQKIYTELQKAAFEVLTKQMTPLSQISHGLTGGE